MMKQYLSIVITIAAFSSVNAQNLERYVPSTSAYVVSIDLERLSKDELKQEIRTIDEVRDLIYAKKGIELISQIVSDPAEYGINIKEKAIVFHHLGDTVENLGILLSISDKETFKKQVGQVVQHNNPGTEFKMSAGLEYISVRNEGIAFNNDIALILFGEQKTFYWNRPSEYYTQRELLIDMLVNDAESVSIDILETDQFSTEFEREPDEQYLYEATEVTIDAMEVEEAVEEYDEYDYEEEAVEMIEEEYDDYDYYEEAVEMIEEEHDDHTIDYDRDHPVLQAFEENWTNAESKAEHDFYARQGKVTFNYLQYYFNLSQDRSVISNESFKEGMNEASDISIWVSGKALSPLGLNRYDRRRYRNAINEGMEGNKSELEKILESNFSMLYIDLNEDQFDLKAVQYMDQELDQYIPVRTEPLDKKFYNFIPKDPVVYLSLNIDPSKFFKMQMHFWKLFLNASRGENYAGEQLAALEMIDLFLDKDVLFHTLTGEGIFVVNDVQMTVREYPGMEYDEETYTSNEVIKYDTSYDPTFLWVMALEKEDYMRRFLSIYEHMGMLHKSEKDYWTIINRRSYRPDKHLSLAIRNGIFFISSDSTFTPDVMTNGLPKNKCVSGNQLDELYNIQNGVFVNRDGRNVPIRKYTTRSMDKMLNGLPDGQFSVKKVEQGKITFTGSFEKVDVSNETLSEMLQSFLKLTY